MRGESWPAIARRRTLILPVTRSAIDELPPPDVVGVRTGTVAVERDAGEGVRALGRRFELLQRKLVRARVQHFDLEVLQL
jgi:hypothetical protein